MKLTHFNQDFLKRLWQPGAKSSKFEGGQVTIIGGSSLFHGAPLWSLKAASRLVDMVYFAGFVEDREVVHQLKASLGSFIWVPREEVEHYLAKSGAALIGPGLMRYSGEAQGDDRCDDQGRQTRELTLKLLGKFPKLPWVIDGGSLQVISPQEIPEGAIVTPNRREFQMLFGKELNFENLDQMIETVTQAAEKYHCVIAAKGPTSVVSDGQETILVNGGNAGLTKGGTGDLIAGLTVGLRAKNDALLSAAAANFLVKKTAEILAHDRGLIFNTDDVAERLPTVWHQYIA